jgi:aminoglycoside 3-N-acetyltransferase
MANTDWDARHEDLLDGTGRMPIAWRHKIAGFDPSRSRAVRDHGIFPEFLRTTPGASLLVDAKEMLGRAVAWLERNGR